MSRNRDPLSGVEIVEVDFGEVRKRLVIENEKKRFIEELAPTAFPDLHPHKDRKLYRERIQLRHHKTEMEKAEARVGSYKGLKDLMLECAASRRVGLIIQLETADAGPIVKLARAINNYMILCLKENPRILYFVNKSAMSSVRYASKDQIAAKIKLWDDLESSSMVKKK